MDKATDVIKLHRTLLKEDKLEEELWVSLEVGDMAATRSSGGFKASKAAFARWRWYGGHEESSC